MYTRIKYFLKSIEHGSFSKAAEALYISPQAMTKQIAKLEEKVGGKLFERNSKGIVLTELGTLAQERFCEADRVFNKALHQVKEYALNAKKKITIGFFTALPKEDMITPIVSYMIGNYPEYQIGFELLEMAEGRKKLEAEAIDLLLTNIGEEDEWRGFRMFSFLETEAKVIVSQNHPWVRKEHITVEDMKEMTFLKLSFPEAKVTVEPEDSFYNRIPCRDVYNVPNFVTMLELLKQGRSFAVVPLVFANPDQAKIQSFDYPGTAAQFYTALLYDTRTKRKDVKKIAEELAKAFHLSEIKRMN